ncbi:ABC transporter ATP-binding protein, partial [Corynebacterium tuscaniense]
MSAVDGTVGPWSLLAPIRTRMRAVVALSVLSSVATVASLVGIIDIAMTYPEAPVHRTWLAVVVIVVAATVRMAADGAAGILSHRADNDLQLHLRRRLVAHI